MELIEVLNSDGTKTGQVVSKAEVHEKGYWHRAAHVWIVNSKNQILLQLRAKKDGSPDKYDISVAGHVSAGDDPLTAAVRETQEELGLVFGQEDFVDIGEVVEQNSRPGYIDNELNTVFLIKKDLVIDELRLQKSEVAGMKWIPFATFKEMVTSKDPTMYHHDNESKVLLRYLKV